MTNPEVSRGGEDNKPATYLEQGIYPNDGDRVSVVKLESTVGMLINPRHLDVRSVGVTGTAVGYVPGHGGDVWFVTHDKQSDDQSADVIGAYSVAEIAPMPAQPEQ